MSKIFKVIANIFLTVIILILSVYVVLKFTNKIGIYKVMTGSMETGIHAGDYILVIKKDNYKKGDIVTYIKDDNYITHRIIKIKDNTVITKGDNNNVEDEAIKKEDIVGKYIYKSKIINFILDYKYVLVVAAIILFIISSLLGNNKEEDKKEEKEEQEEII